MKDFAGNELKKGNVVVVKPSTRYSRMLFGVIQGFNKKGASVITGHDGARKRVGCFSPTSIYLVQGKPKQYNGEDELILELPDGFPEDLVQLVAELNE